MTDSEVMSKCVELRRLKQAQKEVTLTLMRFCVEELKVPQLVLKQMNVADFIDGYLNGRGMFAKKESEGES